MACTSIEIKCARCDETVGTPEMLCTHAAQVHGAAHVTMQSSTFDSVAMFQMWLSDVEDSRCENGGGYLGSSRGPYYEDEYYLLCHRQSSHAKRRRLNETANNCRAVVTCTAFVHVFETMDGRVTVRYCLEHSGHQATTESYAMPSKRCLKRSSPCSVDETPDELNSLNDIISNRLDSTAARLRMLTKVLADLAVDIHRSDQCRIQI